MYTTIRDRKEKGRRMFFILAFLSTVLILSLLVLLYHSIMNDREQKAELKSKINSFNEAVENGQVHRTNIEILSYDMEDSYVNEEQLPDYVYKNSLQILNKENYNWSDLGVYYVNYLDDRNIKQGEYIDAVEVYSDKVKRPILSVYEFKGEYWNPIIVVPKN